MNKLCISRELFGKSSILKAIMDYSGIATVTYTENAEGWNLHFSNCIYGIDRTINEFENYLICIEATNGEGHGSM